MTTRDLYVGVDLGLKGAIAAIGPSGVEQVMPMLTVSAAKGRETYAVASLSAMFADWRSRIALVVAEHLHAMPMEKGGSAANFSRGLALGTFDGMLTALGIPHTFVAPQTWQRAMFVGVAGEDTKQRSIVACGRLFPRTSLMRSARCRKPDDGIADALLLAEWGRRSMLSKEVA